MNIWGWCIFQSWVIWLYFIALYKTMGWEDVVMCWYPLGFYAPLPFSQSQEGRREMLSKILSRCKEAYKFWTKNLLQGSFCDSTLKVLSNCAINIKKKSNIKHFPSEKCQTFGSKWLISYCQIRESVITGTVA